MVLFSAIRARTAAEIRRLGSRAEQFPIKGLERVESAQTPLTVDVALRLFVCTEGGPSKATATRRALAELVNQILADRDADFQVDRTAAEAEPARLTHVNWYLKLNRSALWLRKLTCYFRFDLTLCELACELEIRTVSYIWH